MPLQSRIPCREYEVQLFPSQVNLRMLKHLGCLHNGTGGAYSGYEINNPLMDIIATDINIFRGR